MQDQLGPLPHSHDEHYTPVPNYTSGLEKTPNVLLVLMIMMMMTIIMMTVMIMMMTVMITAIMMIIMMMIIMMMLSFT
jgi:hypothetical protein